MRSEGLTRNVGNFARFLEAISFSHGSQLNAAAVARDAQVERKVVTNYRITSYNVCYTKLLRIAETEKLEADIVDFAGLALALTRRGSQI